MSNQYDSLKKVAYAFAGFAMMLNIRLSYSAAPYALLRFKLPENLFSVFVRIIAGALEIWCLPTIVISNILEQLYKWLKQSDDADAKLLKEAADGTASSGLRGLAKKLHGAAEALASGASDGNKAQDLATAVGASEGTGSAPTNLRDALRQLAGASATELTSKAQAVKTKYEKGLDGAQPKFEAVEKQNKSSPYSHQTKYQAVVGAWKAFDALYNEALNGVKSYLIRWPSVICMWSNFLTFVILLVVYVTGGDTGHVTAYYAVIAVSGFIFGINMALVYAQDEFEYMVYYLVGENSFPAVTSAILYFATSIFGNRRKYNSDYLVVLIDISISIIIAFVAAVVWTVANCPTIDFFKGIWIVLTESWESKSAETHSDECKVAQCHVIAPALMVIVGMGLVYCVYPGIAPGMIVPFYLVDKIEMILLVATAVPPVIVALLKEYEFGPYKAKWNWGGEHTWTPSGGGCKFWGSSWNFTSKNDLAWWHLCDILIPLKICLAAIFIYSLHYRDSSLSRAIVNQPKMSTFLSIIFYMCHEILLAVGFPGMATNNVYVVMPIQMIGAFLMVLLAFYSIGYITEYKRHDPSDWPTDGMTKWNALCYWLKMASKITNKNFKQLFTKDLRRDLVVLSIQWIRFHKINKKYISKFFSIIYN
ncbi:Tpr-related protein family member, putative [Theileria annulata]|uniref:Tpr-related protein family member, putative n=1 Tax=Theileria annulata TaxID=5874 RepID=Q4UCV9_THEAN|nr:Tpr-related protein family member, putative [Theileria annulata]CAI75342.1 Tpr-related protein family member, putative [Theileria annulata]|eukprot:XP_954818.1 Tpr-related protein family member, putative [Theileria annulata]